jgi:peptidoglycan hydrolase-like protein with peptidoglycan-binding domain
VRRLLAGPTRAEIRSTYRTYVPAKTRLRSVSVKDGVATVDLGSRFTSGRNTQSLLARLSQLVGTLSAFKGVASVQLLIDGMRVSGVFPGVPTASPVTFRYLQTPNAPPPRVRKPTLGPIDPHVKQVQQKLLRLGYLVAGDVDGRLGPTTANAILAFQKWEGLKRSAVLDAKTETRLATATRPVPLTHGIAGRRAEVLLDRQVTLLISGNNVVRTIAVSTGKPSAPTPPGSYRVYAKITRWWSVPFREWLPWAVPFVGGIAFHEFPIVPVYPASHGCVRQAVSVARWTYDFAQVGMPVKVISTS